VWSNMASVMASDFTPAIPEESQSRRAEDCLAQSSGTALLGRRRKLWAWRRGSGHRRILEPTLSEPRFRIESGGHRKSGLDSDGRLGSGLLLLGMDRRPLSDRYARSAKARQDLRAADVSGSAVNPGDANELSGDHSCVAFLGNIRRRWF